MAMKMKVVIDPNPTEAIIHDDEVGHALINKAIDICGIGSTFRFSYIYTDEKGNTFVEGGERISQNPDVAALIDAGNYLLHGSITKQKNLFGNELLVPEPPATADISS
ncbi:MAG: hypothetical protein OEX12_13415 [Gammaproteobacteria bacterium]|nr:hypothetical protein [Gammaproteobacteria bacterium]